jgi:hypothetical protein
VNSMLYVVCFSVYRTSVQIIQRCKIVLL